MKAGAYDYVQKPFKPDEVVLALRKAEERELLRRENRALRDEIRKEHRFDDILAKSQKMLDIFRTISKIAEYKTTVLVAGESGVGQELVARAIHHRSTRRGGSFVAVNCGAIPENLLESELFGHKKGAFTDAVQDRRGLFEEADGGSLFLDEIGELPLALQVKLLRVLEEEKIRRVGDVRDIKIDVRIITATHRELLAETKAGRFREDLFYRLNVLPILVPPLRDRREDIPLLIDHFVARNNVRLGTSIRGLDTESRRLLFEYPWPGNVRELENAIERAVILSEDTEIAMELLGLDVELVRIDNNKGAFVCDSPVKETPETVDIVDDPQEDLSLEEYFQRFVLEHQEQMNETELAKKLGISRKCLWERRQRFDIPRRRKSG
jgi:two-component system response regulator AtoC